MMFDDVASDSEALTSSVEAVVEYEAALASARRSRIFGLSSSGDEHHASQRALDFGELVALTAIALESLAQLGWTGLDGLKDPAVRDRYRRITGLDLSDLGPRVKRLSSSWGVDPKVRSESLDVHAAQQECLHFARTIVEARSFDHMKEDAIREGDAVAAHRCHVVASRLRQLVAHSEAMSPILTTLGMAYAEGRMSLVEVARATGLAPDDLVPELERLGYHRQLETLRLGSEDRRARLEQLAAMTLPRENIEEFIRRDLVATHRIEGIDARGLLASVPS